MKLDVKLFARAKEIAGVGCVEIDVPDSANVADLRIALTQRFPHMTTLVPNLLVALGTEYADDTTPLDPAADVACFPPVSGG